MRLAGIVSRDERADVMTRRQDLWEVWLPSEDLDLGRRQGGKLSGHMFFS